MPDRDPLDDAVYRAGRGRRARALRVSQVHMACDYPGGWMCCFCGGVPRSSPDQAPPDAECWNCGATLEADRTPGAAVTREELLQMHVHRLKCDLLSTRKLLRALSIAATTGKMPDGYAPAPTWHDLYAGSVPAAVPSLQHDETQFDRRTWNR